MALLLLPPGEAEAAKTMSSSTSLVHQWLQNVLKPYPARDRVFTDVTQSLSAWPSLAVKTDAYTFDTGQTALLLLLHGTLPISFRGATYHIPLHVWFPLEYPRKPPMVYVVPTKEMGVRKSREVEPGGRVMEQELAGWERKWEAHTLAALLHSLASIFSAAPPVYAKPSSGITSPPPVQRASPPPQSPASPSAYASTSQPRPPPPPQRPHVFPPPQGFASPHRQDALPTYSPSSPATQGPPIVPPHPQGGQPRLPERPLSQGFDPRSALVHNDYVSSPLPVPLLPPGHPDHRYLQQSTQQPPHLYHPQHNSAPQQQHYQQLQQQPQRAQQPHLTDGSTAASRLTQEIQPHYSGQSQYAVPQNFEAAHIATPPVQQPRKAPIPDLLSSENDFDDSPAQASTSRGPAPPPPSKPPPPQTLHLHGMLLSRMQGAVPALLGSLHQTQQQLLEVNEDLRSGEPAIRDEMARLEAVRAVCDTVGQRWGDAVAACEERVADLETRGEIGVDEVVCSISIVHNQLIDLVADDNAIEDTIFHLARALDAERIDLDRFLKATRSLAREQFQKRALIDRILTAMGEKTT